MKLSKQGKDRVELHSLLRRLREQSDYEERLGVLEMVWMVVLADGRLDHIEAQLMRRLAGLLFVSDVIQDWPHRKLNPIWVLPDKMNYSIRLVVYFFSVFRAFQ